MNSNNQCSKTKKITLQQKDIFIDLFVLSFLLAFIEWSFYVTDISISFMYPLPLLKKIEIFLAAGLVITLLASIVQALFYLLDLAISAGRPGKSVFLSLFPQSILESLVVLIVVDNFTYTVFHYGLSTASKGATALYTFGLFLLAAGLIWLHWKDYKSPEHHAKSKGWRVTALVVLGVSLVSLGISYFTSPVKPDDYQPQTQSKATSSYPNIIIFGTDGVNADNMSVYGYAKETTPFLYSWVKDCLISEDNFTNAPKSTGSDTALLTGKTILDTRVIFNPDILRGIDVEEHLPGILHDLGYTTIQQGFPYYIDSGVMNLENAFDSINYGEQSQLNYAINKFFSFRATDEVYLLTAIANTYSTRFQELFFIESAQNYYNSLMNVEDFGQSDKDKIDALYAALKTAKAENKPLFAQYHLMITHGEMFYTQNHVFSQGLTQDQQWMEPFYNDSILDYDGYVRDLVAYLKQIGEYNNTIIIVYTDHAQQWQVDKRIPLIIHFPNDEYAGVITADTQNIDIAPTLLDALGLKIPTWMDGNSLLKPLSNDRLIVSAYSEKMALDNGRWAIDPKQVVPPFYQFSSISAIQCQNIYDLDLDNLSMSISTVENYPDPCMQSSLYTEDQVKEILKQMLINYGYKLPPSWQ